MSSIDLTGPLSGIKDKPFASPSQSFGEAYRTEIDKILSFQLSLPHAITCMHFEGLLVGFPLLSLLENAFQELTGENYSGKRSTIILPTILMFLSIFEKVCLHDI